jgi:hypothetical protein
MQKMLSRLSIATALLVWPGVLAAHHSLAQFDRETAVWVTGTVIRFDRVNPHSLIFVEQTGTGGHVEQWAVDGPAPNALARNGVTQEFLKAGDVITVCGSAMKPEFERARLALGPGSSISGRPLSGHLLVTPDGKRRVWSDYGALEKCLKPGEDKEQLRRDSFR